MGSKAAVKVSNKRRFKRGVRGLKYTLQLINPYPLTALTERMRFALNKVVGHGNVIFERRRVLEKGSKPWPWSEANIKGRSPIQDSKYYSLIKDAFIAGKIKSILEIGSPGGGFPGFFNVKRTVFDVNPEQEAVYHFMHMEFGPKKYVTLEDGRIVVKEDWKPVIGPDGKPVFETDVLRKKFAPDKTPHGAKLVKGAPDEVRKLLSKSYDVVVVNPSVAEGMFPEALLNGLHRTKGGRMLIVSDAKRIIETLKDRYMMTYKKPGATDFKEERGPRGEMMLKDGFLANHVAEAGDFPDIIESLKKAGFKVEVTEGGGAFGVKVPKSRKEKLKRLERLMEILPHEYAGQMMIEYSGNGNRQFTGDVARAYVYYQPEK